MIAAHSGSTTSATCQTPAGTFGMVTVPSLPVTPTLGFPWGFVRRNTQPGTPGSPACRMPSPLTSSNFTSCSVPRLSATSKTTSAEASIEGPGFEKKLTVAL